MRRFLIRFFLRLLVVFAVVLGGLLLFRSHYRPLLRELAETQIKNATSDLTNDALTELLARDSVAYDRIVYFEKDLNGRITAMKTNILEVNRMKTEILEIINQEILDWDTAKLGIPIGSLIFPELFAGKGFCIPVHVLSIRNSDASFESRFQQAGINQTLHRLMMEVNVDASILVLGQTESFSLTSEVVAAETVIVGEVPGTFLNTGGIYGTQTEN
uniref:sporulation protein YunB n=1 Tax=Faecousia sp. TaxID=2952921 RepID=UPI004024F441